MAINIYCPTCYMLKNDLNTKKIPLSIRSSEEITPISKIASAFCYKCLKKIEISIQITKISKPDNWVEDNEIMQLTKRIH